MVGCTYIKRKYIECTGTSSINLTTNSDDSHM